MINNFKIYARATYAKNTYESYIRNIDEMLSYIGKTETDITENDLLLWLEHLTNEGLSSSSRNQHLISVRTYFAYLYQHGIIPTNPAKLVKMISFDNKSKHYMTAEMVQRMIKCATTTRDKAIIMLYAVSGMRVSELTGLSLKKYKEMKANGDNKINIESKRNKQRYVFFNDQVQRLIDSYLRERKNVDLDILFVTTQGNQIARNNLNTMLKKVAKDACIPFWKDMCNHQMRSASATIYYENGMKLNELQELLGHKEVSTTLRYTKTNIDNVSRQVMSISF